MFVHQRVHLLIGLSRIAGGSFGSRSLGIMLRQVYFHCVQNTSVNKGRIKLKMKSAIAALLVVLPLEAAAQNPLSTKLPHPQMNKDSWVMVEIWPDVKDITLAAYFLDSSSYERNRNLCEATKVVFDRDQEIRGKTLRKDMSSYRRCMSVNDAVAQHYIRAK